MIIKILDKLIDILIFSGTIGCLIWTVLLGWGM